MQEARKLGVEVIDRCNLTGVWLGGWARDTARAMARTLRPPVLAVHRTIHSAHVWVLRTLQLLMVHSVGRPCTICPPTHSCPAFLCGSAA